MALEPEQVGAWITNIMQSKLDKTWNEAKRTVESFESAVSALASAAKELHSKSEKEMQTKRDDKTAFKAAKAVNHMTDELVDRLAELAKLEELNYNALRSLESQAEKIHRDISLSRSKWAPDIRPFYLLDMMGLANSIDKVKRTQVELANFIKAPGKQLREVVEIQNKADELRSRDLQIHNINSEIRSIKDRIKRATQLVQDLEKQSEDIVHRPEMRNVSIRQERLRQLRMQIVERGFRRLGRPLRKLEAESSRGSISIQPELRDSLRSYMEAPSRTLFAEEDNYPKLRQVFAVLIDAVSKNKISVKKNERKKIEERYRTVVEENGLSSLQKEGRLIHTELESIIKEPTVGALTEQLGNMRRRIRALKRELEELGREMDHKDDERQRLQAQATELKRQLQERVRDFTGKKIEIALTSTKP